MEGRFIRSRVCLSAVDCIVIDNDVRNAPWMICKNVVCSIWMIWNHTIGAFCYLSFCCNSLFSLNKMQFIHALEHSGFDCLKKYSPCSPRQHEINVKTIGDIEESVKRIIKSSNYCNESIPALVIRSTLSYISSITSTLFSALGKIFCPCT